MMQCHNFTMSQFHNVAISQCNMSQHRCVTTGGTESIILACKAYRDKGREAGIEVTEVIFKTIFPFFFFRLVRFWFQWQPTQLLTRRLKCWGWGSGESEEDDDIMKRLKNVKFKKIITQHHPRPKYLGTCLWTRWRSGWRWRRWAGWSALALSCSSGPRRSSPTDPWITYRILLRWESGMQLRRKWKFIYPRK